MGHSILSAEDVDSALACLSAPQHIDALFVDIRLKSQERGGYEVADQGVQSQPGMRVLYTSGTSLTAAMSELFVAGGQFIAKPYSPAQLAYSLGELLR